VPVGEVAKKRLDYRRTDIGEGDDEVGGRIADPGLSRINGEEDGQQTLVDIGDQVAQA